MNNTNNIRRAVGFTGRRDVDYVIQHAARVNIILARNFTKLINVMDPRRYAEK
jgi:hypothetical protein